MSWTLTFDLFYGQTGQYTVLTALSTLHTAYSSLLLLTLIGNQLRAF